MESMPIACSHPALNTQDTTQKATATSEYATRHNPFVYFHTIIDDPNYCAANDVPLTGLQTDLASAATTPNLVFITPNLCHDGHDSPCADGEPGGLISADMKRITGPIQPPPRLAAEKCRDRIRRFPASRAPAVE
jgi:hypothetical protein